MRASRKTKNKETEKHAMALISFFSQERKSDAKSGGMW